MNIALIPDDEMDNDILTSTAKRRASGVDYFFDYVKNRGEALIRQKRHVTRAVRPTKRYNYNLSVYVYQRKKLVDVNCWNYMTMLYFNLF